MDHNYGISMRILRMFVAGVLFATSATAQVASDDLPDRAVDWLQAYLRVDTINPPGNEIAGARFLAAIFDAEGIPYEMVESAPGRGNIWARLDGGDEPGLLLLHHIDVVPADPNYWVTDPLSGEIRDGFVYGRGALDTKSSGIAHLAALGRLDDHDFGFRVIPAVDRYFRGLTASVAPEWRERYADLGTALGEPGVADELLRDNPDHYGLTRNTCSMTRLGGSDKINVVPTEAWAELDCRLLPDQDPDVFLAELGEVLGDAMRVDTMMGFTPAQSSAETGLFLVLEEATRTHYPDALAVVPSVTTGFTDSHFFRDLGITAYGYEPFVVPAADLAGVHGNNERISVENVRRGVVVMLDILQRWAVE